MGMLQQKYWVDLIKGKYLAVASQGLREPSAPANKMELGSDANPAPTAPANSYSVSATPAKVAPDPKMRDAMLHCKDTMPIWVRGLMGDCCDVFPNKMKEQYVEDLDVSPRLCKLLGNKRCAEPLKDYANIAPELAHIPGITVYVLQHSVVDFVLNTFVHLPQNASLVLVIGGEISGAPVELFGLGSRNILDELNKKGGFEAQHARLPSLQSFLEDPRLAHMFVQNYDLVGCERNYMNSPRFKHGGCKPAPNSALALSKVTAIPLGLDLHTLAEKGIIPGEWTKHKPVNACGQVDDLKKITTGGKPWANRKDCIALTFGIKKTPFETRVELWSLIHNASNKAVVPCFEELETSRGATWRQMTEYRYAFAPPGRGIDTHRFYETLLLGAIPIVVRSSLDELYKPFPVVFIDSWDELMARNVTQKWYDDIVGRFGKEPLSSTAVQERLRQKYWVDLIKRRSQEAELASH